MLLSLCLSRLYNVLKERRFASLVYPETAEATDLRPLVVDIEVKQLMARAQAAICRPPAITEMNRTLGQALRTTKSKKSSRVLAARWWEHALHLMTPPPMGPENRGPLPRPKRLKMMTSPPSLPRLQAPFKYLPQCTHAHDPQKTNIRQFPSFTPRSRDRPHRPHRSNSLLHRTRQIFRNRPSCTILNPSTI